jgi:hypothetical protein
LVFAVSYSSPVECLEIGRLFLQNFGGEGDDFSIDMELEIGLGKIELKNFE